ncbi:OmpA family protein [Hanstruepera flava]|uniref:OmpA family protein n=1 Tax=Hanstruepera flava TaxID=2930218 RepID=UPI0020292A10|nr:OmpA family protein [Hanstruepera flava]
MSKKTLYLLGILFTIVVGTILNYKLCNEDCFFSSSNTENSEIADEPIDNSTKTPFVLQDNSGSLNVNINESLNFKASSFEILEPLSNDVNDGIIKIKNYMLEDSLKALHITGLYTGKEFNNSAFPNLGLARASAIKNYFVSTGIPAKRIDVYSEIDNSLIPDNTGVYYGPLKLSMSDIDDEHLAKQEAILALGEDIKNNPIVLYFDTASSSVELTPEQRIKFINISKYVDKADNAQIHIIGHTDNTGDAASNEKLGQKRADFIKRYFMGNAILESHIITSSKGQSEPIADNSTEEGRLQNRRVVITITN